MKKSYLMIAAAAGLMLTACSSEDDYAAQNTAALEQSGDGAVLFDTYLSNNSTRAGETGIMTTTTLQSKGFGIMAYQGAIEAIGGATTSPTGKPNFMWNQYVGYLSSNWVYSPLKYWPNETFKDKQGASSTDREGVSFYAYAPYVKVSNPDATGTIFTTGVDFDGVDANSVGLIGATKNTTTGAPKVRYKVAYGFGYSGGTATNTLPSKGVDLLWGVSSGFSYHPVNAQEETSAYGDAEVITKTQGLPVEHMYKPALDEKIKFDFKHALARIGLTVVGAFDQKAQGGTLDDKTRITIDEISVTGDAFATEGTLNLDNETANLAKWEDMVTANNIDVTGDGNADAAGVRVTKAVTDEMNPELRFVEATSFPKIAGVKATEQYVLTENTYTSVSKPDFDWKKTYFSSNDEHNPAQIELTSDNIEWTVGTDYSAYKKDGSDYVKVTEWSMNDANMVALKATEITTGTTISDLTSGPYYTKDGSDTYKLITNMDLLDDGSGKTNASIYTLAFGSAPVAKYKTDVYELTTKPRYFMVIPTTTNATTDKDVYVAIKYHVTTYDNKVNGGVVDTENRIQQKVTLTNFTNGKAYNLKIILGLTSVKIDADVTNWEVGTVESNLPQNVE